MCVGECLSDRICLAGVYLLTACHVLLLTSCLDSDMEEKSWQRELRRCGALPAQKHVIGCGSQIEVCHQKADARTRKEEEVEHM